MRSLAISFTALFLLSGCMTTPSSQESVTSFYDYQLLDSSNKTVSLQALPRAIVDADVVLVGEWHTHAAIHRFQTDLLKALIQTPRPIVLSMEQFSREDQTTLDAYLNNEIGEQPLISGTQSWPNYESDYRPLVELAKVSQAPIIAANAPKDTVRCISRNGIDYLDSLPESERSLVAKKINTQDSPYKEKFLASMHHGKPEQTNKHFAAQVTWDETMASSIVTYLKDHPQSQVMHIAGKFHIEDGMGIKTSILNRNPDLKVVVITPTTVDFSDTNLELNDYFLSVLAPPVRFVNNENRMKAYQTLGKRNDTLECD